MPLDLLPPQTAPPGSFEAVTVGCVSKAALNQVPSPATISSRSLALSLSPGLIDLGLTVKTLDPSTSRSLGALGS